MLSKIKYGIYIPPTKQPEIYNNGAYAYIYVNEDETLTLAVFDNTQTCLGVWDISSITKFKRKQQHEKTPHTF